jgi:hypothetical protein
VLYPSASMPEELGGIPDIISEKIGNACLSLG